MCGPKFCSMRINEDMRKMADNVEAFVPLETTAAGN
jgi:hypothetical protein